jgi:hypothetical protein
MVLSDRPMVEQLSPEDRSRKFQQAILFSFCIDAIQDCGQQDNFGYMLVLEDVGTKFMWDETISKTNQARPEDKIVQ